MFKSLLKITTFFIFIFLLFNKNDGFSQNNPSDVIHVAQINTNITTPVRICLDKEDNLYIVDNNRNSVSKYSNSNAFIENFVFEFTPLSIAVNYDFQLFIGDKQTGKIYKRETDGSISLFYSGCVFPASMTFSPNGLLYIADSYHKEVIVLDVSANVVKRFGSETLIFPSSIAYDSRNNRVIVGEHGGIGSGFTPTCKVWIFDLDGNIISSFGSYGGEDGEFYRIHGLTIGKCGNIYVSESYQGNISVFDKTGIFITKFGEYGELTGQLNVPLDIAFDSQERILICSMNNGTVDIYNVTESLPTSNIINSDAIICSGESTDIQIELSGTAPWSFTYTVNSLNPTTIYTSEANNTITVSEPGIYEIIQLSDANFSGTCFTGSASIEVTSNIPTASIPNGSIEVCEDGYSGIKVNLTGDSPWTFTYTVDDLNPKTIKTANNPYDLTINEEGLYQLTYISGNGCIGTELTGSTEISFIPLPTSSFLSGNNAVYICENIEAELAIELTGTPPWNFSYMVNESDTSEITNIMTAEYTLISPLPGSYEIIRITDANCTNYSTLGYPDVIIFPNSIPDFSFEINNYEVSFFNSSINADSYFWDFGDGNSSSELNPIHTYTSGGIFDVNLTTSNSYCDDVSIMKSIEIENTSLNTLDINNNVKIYPIPSSGDLMLEINNIELNVFSVEIYNLIGQKIYSCSHNKTNKSVYKLDIQNYSNGVHFITINSGISSVTKKIVLLK